MASKDRCRGVSLSPRASFKDVMAALVIFWKIRPKVISARPSPGREPAKDSSSSSLK